jgi:hypothetical protein
MKKRNVKNPKMLQFCAVSFIITCTGSRTGFVTVFQALTDYPA